MSNLKEPRGQTDAAGSLSVVLASDQAAVNVLIQAYDIAENEPLVLNSESGVLSVNVQRIKVNDYAIEDYAELWADNHALRVGIYDPTGANIISAVNGLHTTDSSSYIYDGGLPVQPLMLPIAAASSGNNTIVAAANEKSIRVLALTLSASAAVNVKFQSGASGADITGLYYLTTNSQLILPYNPLGWFQTAVTTLLNLNLSGAVPVGGCLTYIEVVV